MHHSTLKIGILLRCHNTSSLTIYDCFISTPQHGQLAGGVLIPIDSARTVSFHEQNLNLPLPVFTLSQC
jgi:hypothetical protein